MDASGHVGDGKYLKVKVLDFLDRRLAGGMKTWRQLAGVIPGFSSIDVDKFEVEGLKIYQSAPILLLRAWENKCGGCDVDQLKRYLQEMGRNDIIMDLKENFEKQGIELVESRSPPTNTEQIHVGAQNNLQPIPQEGQEGQDIVLVAKMYRGTIRDLQIIPHQQESKLLPECRKVPQHLIPHPSPNGSTEQKLEGSPIEQETHMNYSKRNSDPLQRREVSSSQRDQNCWGTCSGSMENVFSHEKDSPRNLKKTQSEVIDPKLIQEPETHACTGSLRTPEIRKEEVSYQAQGDYSSLQSTIRSVRDVYGHGGASPVTPKRYLLLSSNDEQDKQWSKKLCNILTKKGHHVYMVHEVPRERLVGIFYKVEFVVVIYTEKYKKDFQTPGTANQEVFQHMQLEHRTHKSNRRFIPVYDVAVIRLLPDPLLHANSCERGYILDLLSGNNKRPCDGSRMHSSAPSRGATGGVGGAGRATCTNSVMPIRDNHTLSKSEPVIVREYHSPQNHAKPVHTEKKEKQPRFWSKNKKGK